MTTLSATFGVCARASWFCGRASARNLCDTVHATPMQCRVGDRG